MYANAIAPNTNTGTGVEGAPIAYDPEEVISYEAGLKYQTSDNRFRLNGALFRAEYSGLQLPVYFPGTVNTYTSNATGAGFTSLLKITSTACLSVKRAYASCCSSSSRSSVLPVLRAVKFARKRPSAAR